MLIRGQAMQLHSGAVIVNARDSMQTRRSGWNSFARMRAYYRLVLKRNNETRYSHGRKKRLLALPSTVKNENNVTAALIAAYDDATRHSNITVGEALGREIATRKLRDSAPYINSHSYSSMPQCAVFVCKTSAVFVI